MSNDNNGPIVVRGCRVRVREGSGRRRRCHGQGRHVLTRSTENRSGTVSVDRRASQKLVKAAGGQARAPKRVRRKWDVKPATTGVRGTAPASDFIESRSQKTPARVKRDEPGWAHGETVTSW